MPQYIVRFITDRDAIERTYDAPTAQQCLDHAEAHFRTWNFDHGELHEVVVCPPAGETFLIAGCGNPNCGAPGCGEPADEFYRLTEAGRGAIDKSIAATLAKLPATERQALQQRIRNTQNRRRQ